MGRLFRLAPVLALCALLSSGCASVPEVPPLTGADLVEMAKQGRSADEMIAELRRTRTVMSLGASDIVALHESGVPRPVLDHLQRAQMEELLWRQRMMYGNGWGRGFHDCPWGWPPGFRARRGSPWC